MKITFDELLTYALDKALSPEWRDFYLNAPDKVDYDYVSKYIEPEEFLFFIRKTHLFESDNWWYPENIKNLSATKQDGSWMVRKVYRTKAQVKLYEFLPKQFDKFELDRIAVGQGISYDDTHYVRNSKLFAHDYSNPNRTVYKLTPIRPISLPPPMRKEVRYFLDTYYGLFKDHGRMTEDRIYAFFLKESPNKYKTDKYDFITLYKRYLRAKDYYFEHKNGTIYLYNTSKFPEK